MTAEEYRAFLNVDFEDVDINDMPDMAKSKIDRDLTLNGRRKQYMREVGNPYLQRVGNVKVKIRFANNGISFEEAFKNMLLTV